MKNYYNCIYMYTNILNNKVYIGQAKNFNKRHKQHISASYNEKQTYQYNLPIHNAIRKYGIENFKIEILCENIDTQDEMNEYEIFYIKKYNSLANNKTGYNISSGGSNGNPYAGKTEKELIEIGKKISKANKGKKITEEHKKILSEMKKGENNPAKREEVRKKISENHANVKGKNNGNAKKVAQYSKDGELLKIWDYISQVNEELGISASHICACCRNKRKTSGGFVWKYVD